MADYIWPTVYHSLVAYSQSELSLALALDLFPGSVLNYGWHIKLSKTWFYCQAFMAMDMFTIELFRFLNMSGLKSILQKNATFQRREM